MYPKTKSTLFSRHTLSLILGFGLVALIAGVYFLFKPFPAGPSLEVKANVPEAASAAGWSAYANAPIGVSLAASMPSSVGEFALSQQRNFGASSVNSAASMPSSVGEFALSQQRNFAPSSVNSAASMPSSVREFASSQQRNFAPASVAGWSAYANPPTIVKSDDVQKPLNPKSPESLRRR